MQEEAEEGEIDFSAPMVKFPRRNEKRPVQTIRFNGRLLVRGREARNFLVKEYERCGWM